MRRWPLTGVALAALWLFVRGVELAPVRVAGELVIGLLVGLPIAFGIRRFYAPSFPLAGRLRVLPYAVLYLATFLKEVITANVDVAWRVLAPSMPIDPDVFEIPLRVRHDAAVTTIANSITLTPGTLTMDYDAEANSLYVHSITSDDRASVLAPIRRWEDYALVIFDEELSPGDPVPEPGSDAAPGGGADAPGGDADDTGVDGDE